MTIAALQSLLPLDDNDGDNNNNSIDDRGGKVSSGNAPGKDVNLVELMSKFHSYNKSLAQMKYKLQPIGSSLDSFSEDLKNLSLSLVSLEQQSNDLSKDSRFNKTTTRRLEQVINEKVLPPDAVKEVLKEDLSNQYLEKVNSILERVNSDDAVLIKAKVVERVRDFLIDQIRLLRSNKTSSSQQIQRRLLNASNLFHFMRSQQPELASQLQNAYSHTMRWYYRSKFAKYIYALEKLQKRHLETSVFDSPNYLSTFEQRIKNLTASERCMPSQLAETISAPYMMEFVVRQLLLAVVSNASVEYLFYVEFFYQGDEKDQSWAPQMFGDVFEMSRDFLKYVTTGTCDIYGVLLSIKLVHLEQSKLHDNHIPILDEFLNSLLLILWPICTKIIDLNCDSLKRHMTKSPLKSLAPISITQQFGLFLSALLRLSANGEPLKLCITRLTHDYENGITKASNHFKGVDRDIFLYNNYFLILNIVKIEAEDATEEINHFKLLADAYKT
ncbi:uncharacterized protein LODBEIA_P20360 [Lodderomyces beijingensis]|uniref:Uncharacterized protein n=1 Tax=Lodderomyces beijingensis TaxID=1775926 RepID=A0ABP0ZI18_9ASCO